jgi:D-glycero-D-manno-heptose 1,7-bisphosphate phosphatase
MGMKIAVVTNQAGVAKGLYGEVDVLNFHNVMNSSQHANGAIDLFVYCPHHPSGVIDKYRIVCNCRKPSSQMIEFALNHFEIRSSKAILFGDSSTDVEAGNAVGVESILVRPGSIYKVAMERLFSSC